MVSGGQYAVACTRESTYHRRPRSPFKKNPFYSPCLAGPGHPSRDHGHHQTGTSPAVIPCWISKQLETRSHDISQDSTHLQSTTANATTRIRRRGCLRRFVVHGCIGREKVREQMLRSCPGCVFSAYFVQCAMPLEPVWCGDPLYPGFHGTGQKRTRVPSSGAPAQDQPDDFTCSGEGEGLILWRSNQLSFRGRSHLLL